jgi:ABC-2 type transport system permease protein
VSGSISIARFWAVLVKEFIQMRRDRLTFAMMIGFPIIQLILFGFAINSDPKQLPTAVLSADNSMWSRSLVRAIEHTGYFRIVREITTEAEAQRAIARGSVQFVVTIPENFGRKIERGEKPVLLIEADATDPAATSNALGALTALNQSALTNDLKGPLENLRAQDPPFQFRVQRRYNPEGITQYNIVPGLMGVVLTMTMVVMTSLGLTREYERGTMESLLATPVRPLEVMVGKIVPYIVVGYIQVGVILIASRALFSVPMVGSLALLSLAVIFFIAANLAVGFTFSTLSRSQMQSMQMAMFFFLPSLLLSGFMFPFRGMPQWAQWLGEVFPLTHFLRIVRGILLKGNSATDIVPEVGAILAFLLVMAVIALNRYRETLD